MPVPNSSFYVGQLAAYGSNGAAPNTGPGGSTYKQSRTHSNASPVVLTGVNQLLALDVELAFPAGAKMLITGSVNATATAGSSGQLVIDLEIDGSPIVGDIIQSMDTSGTGVTATFRFEATGLAAGTRQFSLLARATGDATLTVPAGLGVLITEIVTV